MDKSWEGVMIECPFCRAEIDATALKCRYCSEFVKQSDKAKYNPPPKKSAGIAALLSFLIPGAGQMYRDKVLVGFLWLLFVIIGYAFFIIPGLILHFFCVISAAISD